MVSPAGEGSEGVTYWADLLQSLDGADPHTAKVTPVYILVYVGVTMMKGRLE